MERPTRRSLLTATAALAATPSLAAGNAPDTSGETLLVTSRAAARALTIPTNVQALQCSGYTSAGDRGQALYVRRPEEPSHAAKFTTGDGAWWELAENILNPFHFGAKGDGRTDDSGAIQAMFDYVAARRLPFPMQFLGASYRVAKPLTLPTVPEFVTLDLDGGGAVLQTDEPITILSRLPKDQEQAIRLINGSHYDIHHFEFRGSGKPGQTGLHLGATFTNLVRNCTFMLLDYGSIGSFCLASAWRDNLYHLCAKRGAVLQSATGYDQGVVWPGANEPNSPCNVSVFENCRVFGHPRQISAFGIFGSDAVRMNGCISEGGGASIDVHFDFQGSPTVKNFHVHMFHCEARSTLNFKVRSSGIVKIDGVVLSVPAAVYDAQGSINCEVFLKNISWMVPPVAGGPDANNPNGRWFYHSDGGGYGGTEGGSSRGTQWLFENWPLYKQLQDPAHWENGTLPAIVHVRGMHVNGMMEWSNCGTTFQSLVRFRDGSSIDGMRGGSVTLSTTTLAAHAEATETFKVPGLLARKDVVIVNPETGFLPPAGLMWNAWIPQDDTLNLRLVNTSASSIDLPTGTGKRGMVWNFTAPRRG